MLGYHVSVDPKGKFKRDQLIEVRTKDGWQLGTLVRFYIRPHPRGGKDIRFVVALPDKKERLFRRTKVRALANKAASV